MFMISGGQLARFSSKLAETLHLVYNIDGLNIKNSDELLERLTPFFYYLVSTYLRKNGNCNLLTAVDVYFPHRYSHLCGENHLRIMHFWVKNSVCNSFMSGYALKSMNSTKNIIFMKDII